MKNLVPARPNKLFLHTDVLVTAGLVFNFTVPYKETISVTNYSKL